MNRIFRALPCLLLLCALAAPAADDDAKREKKITETRAWLTNSFVPWLTNTFPEVTTKYYPDWLVNPPSKTRLPTWLTNTFHQIDTEEFPEWLANPDEEMLAKGIPDWFKDVQAKIPTVPPAKTLPAIVRGPYLQMGTTNSMVVRWRTDRQTAAEVRYGSSPEKLSRKAKASGTLTEHVVIFTNLQPDTKYFYSIGTADTPLLIRLTNKLARLRATNSVLYLSPPNTNSILAAVTNGELEVSVRLGRLAISGSDGKLLRQTTNTQIQASTVNTLLNLNITDGEVAVSTTDHVKPLDGGETGRKAKKPTRYFLVGNTNLTYAGGDSNTFFITHPPIGTRRPVRAWILGDPGTRKKEQRAVRDAYYKWNGDRATDLWLMLGDNAYTTGKDDEYQGAVFAMYDPMLRKSVLWPCLGNHDAGSANSLTQSGVYYDLFTLPTQGQAGGVMSGTESYYSFDYANIHFVCLDSSDSDWSETGLMMRWLKHDLEQNLQDWLVVFFHHPPFTKGSHDSDKDKDNASRMDKVREVALPMLEEHGLDLCLVGHSHAYERSYLLDGAYVRSTNVNPSLHFKSALDGRLDGTGAYRKPSRGPAPNEGAVYLVAGSSGQTSGGKLDHPVMALSLNVLGSLVLDVNDQRLDVTFLDEKAQVRDYFTILKGGARP